MSQYARYVYHPKPLLRTEWTYKVLIAAYLTLLKIFVRMLQPGLALSYLRSL